MLPPSIKQVAVLGAAFVEVIDDSVGHIGVVLNLFSVRTHALKNSLVREDGRHLVVAAEDGLGRTVVDDCRCLAGARVGGQLDAVFRVGREDVVLVGVAGHIPRLDAFKSSAALFLAWELDL